MASSGSTDENFRARVEKIFGSLAFSRSSSLASSPALLWSLSDGDVEKREWRRDKSASYVRDETPCASSFDELLKQQRSSRGKRKPLVDDLEDLDEEGDDQLRGRDEDDGDEWSIRSSIGLDRTLDDEEEEDEYDKVASGRENTGDRLYMKDITDQGSSLDSRGAPPKSSDGMIKDRRANHAAAKMRLKEDEVEAKKLSTSHNCSPQGEEPHSDSSKVVQPRPILKRKDNSSEARPSKRVRFDLGCGNNAEEALEKPEDMSASVCSVDASASETESRRGKSGSQIPDYLLNPSRYTCYSFDSSSNIDDKSNTQAYMDFLKLVRGSKAAESDLPAPSSAGGLKKVMFIPQKKTKDGKEDSNTSEIKESSEDKMQETLSRAVPAVSIAAGEAAQDGLNATEDEDAEIGESDRSSGFRKAGRQYRAKRSLEETDT